MNKTAITDNITLWVGANSVSPNVLDRFELFYQELRHMGLNLNLEVKKTTSASPLMMARDFMFVCQLILGACFIFGAAGADSRGDWQSAVVFAVVGVLTLFSAPAWVWNEH